MKKISALCILLMIGQLTFAQGGYRIALVKYKGGGDWYANPTSLPNLIRYFNQVTDANILADPATVDPSDPAIFNYPFLHMTGHGNVVFPDADIQNLRKYLMGGGFLHIDDNYGMDAYIRPQIKKLFPDSELIELSSGHSIFHKKFEFPNGLPKIHEHDNKAPQAFGIIYEGRLVLLYTFECDLGDGWEDYAVHKDPESKHIEALQMGVNILMYVFGL